MKKKILLVLLLCMTTSAHPVGHHHYFRLTKEDALNILYVVTGLAGIYLLVTGVNKLTNDSKSKISTKKCCFQSFVGVMLICGALVPLKFLKG